MQRLLRPPLALTSRRQHASKVTGRLTRRMHFDLLRSPFVALLLVAANTGIGYTQLGTQIRPRQTKAVIPSIIDAHIGTRRHMAIHTGTTGARQGLLCVRTGGGMKMMVRRIVNDRL